MELEITMWAARSSGEHLPNRASADVSDLKDGNDRRPKFGWQHAGCSKPGF